MTFESVLRSIEGKEPVENNFTYFSENIIDEALKEDGNPRVPKDIINSGNVDVIMKYLEKNCEQMTHRDCQVLINRVIAIKKVNKYESENADKQCKPLVAGHDNKGNVVFSGLKLDNVQGTKKGCWSCTYSLLLQSRNVNLLQHEIRSYHGDEMKGEKNTDFRSVNMDMPLNPTEKADILMKVAPNTAFKEINFEITQEHCNYLVDEGVPGDEPFGYNVMKADVKAELKERAFKYIRECIDKDHSPVGLMTREHFITIVGYTPDGKLLCINSNNPNDIMREPGKIDLEDYMDLPVEDGMNQQVSIVSIVDINVNENNPSETILPEDFKNFAINADGTVKSAGTGQCQVIEESESVKSIYSLESKSLPKSGLKYIKKIYMPKNLNPNAVLTDNPRQANGARANVEAINRVAAEAKVLQKDVKKTEDAGNLEIIANKAYYLGELLVKMANMQVTQDIDEDFYNIAVFMANKENRLNEQNHIAKLCFDYLDKNRLMASNRVGRGRFDMVMSVLGLLDYDSAKYLEEAINHDQKVINYRECFNKHLPNGQKLKPVSVDACVIRNNIVGEDKTENTYIMSKAMEDTRIANLKQVYKKLSSFRLDSIFHINSSKFENMMEAMRQVFKYGEAIDQGVGKREILNEMLLEVENRTKEYLKDKKAEPKTYLGEHRVKLALAALVSVNRERAEENIAEVASIRKAKDDDKWNIFNATPKEPEEYMSYNIVADYAGISTRYSLGEKIDALDKRMELIRGKCFEYFTSYDNIGGFIVSKTLRNRLLGMTEEESDKYSISTDDLSEEISKITKSQPFIDLYFEIVLKNNPGHFEIGGKNLIDCDDFYKKYMDRIVKEKQEEALKNQNKLASEKINNIENNAEIDDNDFSIFSKG